MKNSTYQTGQFKQMSECSTLSSDIAYQFHQKIIQRPTIEIQQRETLKLKLVKLFCRYFVKKILSELKYLYQIRECDKKNNLNNKIKAEINEKSNSIQKLVFQIHKKNQQAQQLLEKIPLKYKKDLRNLIDFYENDKVRTKQQTNQIQNRVQKLQLQNNISKCKIEDFSQQIQILQINLNNLEVELCDKQNTIKLNIQRIKILESDIIKYQIQIHKINELLKIAELDKQSLKIRQQQLQDQIQRLRLKQNNNYQITHNNKYQRKLLDLNIDNMYSPKSLSVSVFRIEPLSPGKSGNYKQTAQNIFKRHLQRTKQILKKQKNVNSAENQIVSEFEDVGTQKIIDKCRVKKIFFEIMCKKGQNRSKLIQRYKKQLNLKHKQITILEQI